MQQMWGFSPIVHKCHILWRMLPGMPGTRTTTKVGTTCRKAYKATHISIKMAFHRGLQVHLVKPQAAIGIPEGEPGRCHLSTNGASMVLVQLEVR